MKRIASVVAQSLLLASGALGQVVTVSLTSPQDGQLLAAGAEVQWQISVTVSDSDNAGLALLSCDLVQGASNAQFFDIPPAVGVPAGMEGFSRPDGVSNPGESDPLSGYGGVQRGTAGARNLVQIGGGQNTLGIALPPGTGLAESAVVLAGVGQSGPVIVASGAFAAPPTCGEYEFELSQVVANVLTAVHEPPNASPVARAQVQLASPSLGFTVGLLGDSDGDGDVDLADLSTVLQAFGVCEGEPGYDPAGDLDASGCVNLADLSLLLSNFGVAGC